MKSCRKTVKAILVEATELIGRRYSTFLEDPSDPETNHKLRVSIRTLRSLIDFVSPWQKPKQNALVQKNLKRVVQRTSKLRELDVLCDMVREGGGSEELIEFCEEKAATERAAVHAALKSGKLPAALELALDETCAIRWEKSVARKGLKPKAVRARFDEMTGTLKADLESLDVTDYERMHDVRKRAKQVRYVSEQFESILGPDVAQIAQDMKDEQDRLGALCDAKVNLDIVATFIAQEDLSPDLAAELRRIVS